MSRFVPLLLLLAAPVAARGAEPSATPAEVVKTYDLTYATAGAAKLQLDLAAPKAGGPHPAVVCLHGGAWKSGSRKDLSRPVRWADFGTPGKSLIEILAGRGYVGVSVSYRLAPRDKFPAQIQDVRTAVRFLRANAKQLNIDPDRIAALGFSAGGHLAALLGTADPDPVLDGHLYPEESSRVSCVIDFFGPSDLTLYAETPGIEKAFFAPLLGGVSKDKPELYKKASPITHVSKDDPPFLLVHGTADILVPILHSERLYKKLTDAGVKAEFLAVKGKGHGWGGPEAAETIDATARFLGEHLRK
jgi:acetyl esterase/lipase